MPSVCGTEAVAIQTRLGELSTGFFFRVVSSTVSPVCAEYQSKFMMQIIHSDLPHELRISHSADDVGLFLVLAVEPVPRFPTRVIVKEVDFDLADTTLVEQVSPVEEKHMKNGAVVLMHEKDVAHEDLLRIGRIDHQGMLKRSLSRGQRTRFRQRDEANR